MKKDFFVVLLQLLFLLLTMAGFHFFALGDFWGTIASAIGMIINLALIAKLKD